MSGLDFVGYVFGGLLLLGAVALLGVILWICFSPTFKRIRAQEAKRSEDFEKSFSRVRRDIDHELEPRTRGRWR